MSDQTQGRDVTLTPDHQMPADDDPWPEEDQGVLYTVKVSVTVTAKKRSEYPGVQLAKIDVEQGDIKKLSHVSARLRDVVMSVENSALERLGL